MKQETVLLVEDDYEIRAFLRDAILMPTHYRVLTAGDGQEGLQLALTEEPDVILLDLKLPYISGLDLLETLRKHNRFIPAIIMTVYGSEESILRAFRLGAKEFLLKPFGIDEALGAIEKALAEERLRREKENLTLALAKANQRLQCQVNNWAALNDIAQIITSTLDEKQVLHRVMENVNRILQVEAGSLLLLDEGTDELRFAVTIQGDTARFSNLRLKLGQGIAGWVAQHKTPLLVPDVRCDPRFYARVDQVTGSHTYSALCVPLQSKDAVIGVLEVINKREGPASPSFTQGDLELLTTLASWVTVAVENARLDRAAQEMAAVTVLRQTVTTVAHHINNRLMAFSLELDKLESYTDTPESTKTVVTLARRVVHEISAIIKALDRLDRIRTVPYVGSAQMIDIEGALEKELS